MKHLQLLAYAAIFIVLPVAAEAPTAAGKDATDDHHQLIDTSPRGHDPAVARPSRSDQSLQKRQAVEEDCKEVKLDHVCDVIIDKKINDSGDGIDKR